jgi:hypothetical protein
VPPNYEAVHIRPECRLTLETKQWLQAHFGKQDIQVFVEAAEHALSLYLRWSMQVEKRPSKSARAATIRALVKDINFVTAALEAYPQEVLRQIEGRLAPRLQNPFIIEGPGELLGNFPAYLVEFAASLPAEILQNQPSGRTKKRGSRPFGLDQRFLRIATNIELLSGAEPRLLAAVGHSWHGQDLLPENAGLIPRYAYYLSVIRDAGTSILARGTPGPDSRISLEQAISMLAEPYERASGKTFTHNAYIYKKRPDYKGLALSHAGLCMSRIFCEKSVYVCVTEPVTYRWPKDSEIATAMRGVISRREKAD